MKFISNSAEETSELGYKIGKAVTGGEVILLSGNLGVGKTLLTKGIGEGLGIEQSIISPTFTIERTYPGELTLHHFDFYRLGGPDSEITGEINELIQDHSNVIVVEWPENQKFCPSDYLAINFAYLDDDKRQLDLSASGEKGKRLLERL